MWLIRVLSLCDILVTLEINTLKYAYVVYHAY